MKPVRKHFNHESSFPFYLVYKDRKSPQLELPDHMHEWNEIIFVYSGKGTIFIDQTFYDIEKGDVIIIPTDTIHRVIPEKTNLISSTAIFFCSSLIQHASIGDSFTYSQIFEEAKKRKSYKHNFSPQHFTKLDEYIDQLMYEERSLDADKQNAVLLWLHLILLTLNRKSLSKSLVEHTQSRYGPKWMKETLTYINQNISDELNLHFLSKRASVSEAHFSRVFKQLVGMNASHYITIKRINLAKDWLLNHEIKISTIANQCGYNSMPHFYRTFKKQTSMTPSEFRKRSAH